MRLDPEQRVVHCENGDILYLLTRKSVKNVNLRIKPEGKVLVSANDSVPLEFIDAFIEKKQRYIFSVLSRYEEKKKLIQSVPKRYVSGESYDLLGKSLRLKVEANKDETVYTDGVYIFLRGPVDFKVSRGQDKTLIEVKLSSNSQYLHGYEVQVEEYGKAENTDKLVYVLVDVGNPLKVKN